MDIYSIAMEAAEDITTEVEDETNKAVGKKTAGLKPKDDKKEDMSKTDDIFGTANTDDDPTNDVPEDKDDNKEEEPVEDGETDAEDAPTDDDPSTDDNNDVNNDDELSDEENIPDTNSDEAQKKLKLLNGMITLYNILGNNIDLLSDYSVNTADAKSVDILYKVSDNLKECRGVLYKDITANFSATEYVVLLKNYIAMKNAYFLCIEILKKHFEDLDLQSSKKSKTSPKEDKVKDKK